jgi:ABC-2 type transport system permease protein
VIIASCGFWIGRTWALNETWSIAVAALSGWLFPLALVPAWIGEASAVLPFRYMLSLPVELLAGDVRGGEAAAALLIGVAWLAAFTLAMLALWRRGLKVYEAHGG